MRSVRTNVEFSPQNTVHERARGLAMLFLRSEFEFAVWFHTLYESCRRDMRVTSKMSMHRSVR